MLKCVFIFWVSICLNCYGYFFSTNNLVILKHDYYTIGYSTNYLNPIWVEYVLTSNMLSVTERVKRTDDFRPDPLITNITERIIPSYYNKSGFDKGHLCPAQDMGFSTNSISETFYMSNMSPQDPGFNRGIWKRLEEYTREFVLTNGYDVTVVTGCVIFERHTHGGKDNRLCVPELFYKILIRECFMDGFVVWRDIQCFMIPNEKLEDKIEDYIVDWKYVKKLVENTAKRKNEQKKHGQLNDRVLVITK